MYRTVLTLIDMYELDCGEAAQILNIPLGTVKVGWLGLRMAEKFRSAKKHAILPILPDVRNAVRGPVRINKHISFYDN